MRWRRIILPLAAVIIGACAVTACGSHHDVEVTAAPEAAAPVETTTTPETLANDRRSVDTTSGETTTGGDYEDAEGDADCTTDCSGHEAGWAWAKEHEVTDEAECGGNSKSFTAGCEAYARHRAKDEGEDDDSPTG